MKCLGMQILPGDGRAVPQDVPDLLPTSLLMLQVQSQVVDEPANASCHGFMPFQHKCVHLGL